MALEYGTQENPRSDLNFNSDDIYELSDELKIQEDLRFYVLEGTPLPEQIYLTDTLYVTFAYTPTIWVAQGEIECRMSGYTDRPDDEQGEADYLSPNRDFIIVSVPPVSEEPDEDVTPKTTTIYDITPGVKKKEIKATIDKAVQDYQDRYGIIPVTLSQTGWNLWDGEDNGQYREYKQTVTVALENDDFILIDADGIYSDKMSEFNIYGKAGTTSADTDGDGIVQLTSIDFFADEIPDMDIVCNIIVFAYNDGDKGKPKTIEERLTALEERLSDIGEP